jgi:uncharacterized membrane protein SirB2
MLRMYGATPPLLHTLLLCSGAKLPCIYFLWKSNYKTPFLIKSISLNEINFILIQWQLVAGSQHAQDIALARNKSLCSVKC